MRAVPFIALVAALGLAVVGLGAGNPSHPVQLKGGCAKANLDLYADGKLSLATDNLSFPPWWGGKAGHGFDPSDPYSGKGYEGAVVLRDRTPARLREERGHVEAGAGSTRRSHRARRRTTRTSRRSRTSPVRAKVFDFSSSYYFVNQAVVGLKGTPITKVKTLKGLKAFTLGAPVGTTSYSYITRYIKPAPKPKVYDSVNDTIAALKAKQIDGFVVDFPSTGYITGVQLPTATVVGRLPTQGTRERFGLIFAKGATLDGCVSKVLAAMRADGTLKRYESKWLAGTAPILK